MTKRLRTRWWFASTGGGVKHGYNNAGAEHFRSAPEEKLIREIIQNSLDAAHPEGIRPVEVDIFPCNVDPEDIGAKELKQHMLSCRQFMNEKGQSEGVTAYTKGMSLLRKRSIPALAVVDRNTTGLIGSKWDSLIFEEGIPAKNSESASGGSFGIGKNAPYNAAELRSVIYSTLYSNASAGRVEKMAGRAVLVSHPCPEGGEMMQNVGFLTESGREAVRGKNIPKAFRLKHTGTGLWILGFRPGSRWGENAVKATAENFFRAIHSRNLVVNIRASQKENPIVIRHDTIERILDTGIKKSDSFYFFRAIRQPAVETTNPVGHIGSFDVYVYQNEKAPNRVAYVNRRGMLVTATKERRKSNPFHPARGVATGWSNYAAVVIASNDGTDKQIRRMENPAHDEISLGRLAGHEAEELRNAVQNASELVTDILGRRLRSQEEIDLSNLRELASLFPDLDPKGAGNRELVTRTINSRGFRHNIRPEREAEPSEGDDSASVTDPEGEQTGKWGTGNGKRTGGGNGSPNRSSQRNPVPRGIQDMVIMRTGQGELKLAIIARPEFSGKVSFSLHPDGEEFRNADRISIEEVKALRPNSLNVSISDNVLTLVPTEIDQGHITISLSIDPNTPTSGYRFYERKVS